MTPVMLSAAERIEEDAAQWLARRESGRWSDADQTAFGAWLQAATAHEVAYLRLEYGWGKAERLSILKKNVSAAAPDVASTLVERGVRASRRSVVWGGAIAAIIGVAIVSTAVLWRIGAFDALRGQRYATEIGGHETIALADGSRMELNTNTRVRADFNDDVRRVWLDRGEVYLDVAQEASRPFVVHAGARRVTVLGTRFAVRKDGDRIQVSVTEGRVRLEPPRGLARSHAARPLIATSGVTLLATKDAQPTVELKSPERVATALSWRQGLLVFDRTALADAAAEFNRYNRRQLVVAEAVKDIRIGGSFEATNLAAFVRLLRQGFSLQTAAEDDRILISD